MTLLKGRPDVSRSALFWGVYSLRISAVFEISMREFALKISRYSSQIATDQAHLNPLA